VIERASGMLFGEFLGQRIWAPLGMDRTRASFADVQASGDGNVSRPHHEIRDTIRVIDDELVDVLPAAGAVWSTASDMARWARFLLDSGRVDGERLLRAETFAQLFQPHTIIPADQFYPTARRTNPHWTTYSLGWFQQDYHGQFVSFHTGSLDGRIAIIGLLPEQRFGIVMLGNLDHAEFRHALMLTAFDLQLGAPGRDWSAELLELYAALAARADSARARRAAQRVPDTHPSLPLDAYAGTYTHPVWGDVSIVVDADQLILRVGTNEQTRGPLEHWHYDTFRAHAGDGRSDPMWVSFTLGSNGRVAELRLGVGGRSVFRRRN
jgi:CubicO group peptidase (beta-lactamase class C family)